MTYSMKVAIFCCCFAVLFIVIINIIDKKTRKAKSITKEDKKAWYKGYLVVFILIIIAGSFARYYGKKNIKSTVLHEKITSGVITGYRAKGYAQSDKFLWQCNINNLDYSYERTAGIWPDSGGESFIGKYFPVIYDTTDVKNNFLLIFPEDFKRYGILFPDSLKWVTEYRK